MEIKSYMPKFLTFSTSKGKYAVDIRTRKERDIKRWRVTYTLYNLNGKEIWSSWFFVTSKTRKAIFKELMKEIKSTVKYAIIFYELR